MIYRQCQKTCYWLNLSLLSSLLSLTVFLTALLLKRKKKSKKLLFQLHNLVLITTQHLSSKPVPFMKRKKKGTCLKALFILDMVKCVFSRMPPPPHHSFFTVPAWHTLLPPISNDSKIRNLVKPLTNFIVSLYLCTCN